MVNRLIASVLTFLIIQSSALAATDIQTVASEGVGKNREEAIFNALGEAVRQVRGAEISANRQVKSALSRMSVRTSDGRQANVEIESRTSGSTKVASEGLVKGYRIKSVTDIGGGQKRAKLDVDVPVYRSPGGESDDGRWRMAVYPVSTPRSVYPVLGYELSRTEVSSRMTQAITEALVQSRRFAVLARDREEAIANERERMAKGNVPVSEKAMLGNELGAEYLVSAQVTDFSLKRTEETSEITGERMSEESGGVVMEVRVVVPATGKIVWSRTLNLAAAELGISGKSRSDLQNVFQESGRKVALNVIDAVWPPLVEERQGDQLIINMGGDVIRPGQKWDVFSLGRNVENSHSGESLGRAERKVATVEVVRTTPEMAYAKVVEGTVKGTGHVLRHPRSSAGDDRSDVERGTRERTCLPMDPCS